MASPTTAEHLQRAIRDTEPKHRLSIGIPSRTVSMDQCYPNLYIGNSGAAMSKTHLKSKGITHVLNAAQGRKVDTNAEYYRDAGIKFLGLPLEDSPTFDIRDYLKEGADFIHEAISSDGKVLVCCFMGVSRSATIACGYLMLKKGMRAVDAITMIRRSREIEPNIGFLTQLAELDNSLRKNQ